MPSPKSANAAEERLRDLQRAALLFKQLSDPTRLLILSRLSESEVHVGALHEELSVGQQAVSHHLALLRNGGVVAARRQGTNLFYGLTAKGQTLVTTIGSLMP